MTAIATPPGELEPIETALVDELRALQLERLRWSLGHAYQNVPYYRKMFDAAGARPDDLADLADLARFPFTTKASLRDNYPFGMFAVPREQVARVHASSGTTGRPTVGSARTTGPSGSKRCQSSTMRSFPTCWMSKAMKSTGCPWP